MNSQPDATTSEALGVARLAAALGPGGAILLAHSEAQAVRLAGAARALAGGLGPVHLPAWDCLPFDRASPSHAVMGQRMRALRLIRDGAARLVILSADSAAQKLPRAGAATVFALGGGDAISRDEVEAVSGRLGYARVEEAELPGEVAVHPSVIDLFPADGHWPVRIRFGADGVEALERIDTRTRRALVPLDRVEIGAASELVLDAGDDPHLRTDGAEHALAALRGPLDSVFALLPDATLLLDDGAADALHEALGQIRDARETRVALARSGRATMPEEGLYLAEAEWDAVLAGRRVETIEWPAVTPLPVLLFRPDDARDLVEATLGRGGRVGFSGRRLAAALDREEDLTEVADWTALLSRPAATAALLPDGLGSGFEEGDTLVLAADDVLPPLAATVDPAALFAVPLAIGDTVIHLDHGLARLEGLQTVETGSGPTDCLSLAFSGDARTLAPCDEMDRVWRHGAPGDAVTLDRADGSSWAKRCGPVIREIERTAGRMVEEAAARARETAPAIRPDRRRMARFVAGFPYPPTPDQTASFEAIAADLASGRPMHRLLCGEAGFGKTEAALRAAAATVLAGHQVAILAPTTVLVRQHAETFRRRFASLGIETASLSRLTPRAEATSIRKRLADGSLQVVIGTQGLASDQIAFRDLALVVIDEEQRFGTEDKARLQSLRQGIHALVLSATPIPRTLERALAGLEELSVLATPPVRRLPVRTEILERDEALIATALRREHGRGGQSFVICPRIKDLDAIETLLGALVPELSVVVLHGRMKPDALDATMVGFAEGHGDVLLATNIIEAGLDIPRANTLLVFDAERFGLGQLHQIRGRVGRGRHRGHAFFFRRPDGGRTAAARLAALRHHDGLGGGFALSGEDLDQRGAGDLLGDEQAGHARLLGLPLARHLTARAVRVARGDAVPPEWRPDVSLGLALRIPADYVEDEHARIALHARLARPHRVRDLRDEIEDRFGPIPEAMRDTLAAAEIRQACRRFGVARLEVGPAGAAAALRDDDGKVAIDGLRRKGRRHLLRRPTASAAERIALARHVLRLLSRRPGVAGGIRTPRAAQAADARDAEPPSTANRSRAAPPMTAPA